MTKTVTIDNPVINSPFSEPVRHFKFDDRRITEDIVEMRRQSQYFIPVPKPRSSHSNQMYLDLNGGTGDILHENKFINNVREQVGIWRRRGYFGVTPVTRQLLSHWTASERVKKFFFCQIEAIETLIYITEAADKDGKNWIWNELRLANEMANPKLLRIAFKMATGTGKTVVMAMIIAWHTLNKLANRQDRKFSDAFLIVTPGITIRDRLRVLLPNDPQNYYDERDILPNEMRKEIDQARIVITNYHSFSRRTIAASSNIKITSAVLQSAPGAFTETQNQMVLRVLRQLGNKKNIVVINDEAHHCYRRKPDDEDAVKLQGEEKREADNRNKEAHVWISGIEAVKEKIGIKAVYDLSATPFFLKGAGYSRVITGEDSEKRKISEGVLFPWVVSDFSLIDAIESGLVKVPRVPVADNTMTGMQPTYRDLWIRIRDKLPKQRKSKATGKDTHEPKLPAELEGALLSLYANYKQYHQKWKLDSPPVMIIVCNNTTVSKLVYDWVAGYEITLPSGEPYVKQGNLPIFNNEIDGKWLPRPNTILIDSIQLESGDAIKGAFKKIAAKEIEQFKADYLLRFPGRNVDNLTDEDLLREVMNTVGKSGKLGEQVKCVVSVSMLSEGWDANTVTHILGVRAFGTQLLCEQVVGRGLRRTSYESEPLAYDPKSEGFRAEYAEVYGIPFSFIPSAGTPDPIPPPPYTHVQALPDRIDYEITFPKLIGYYHRFETDKIEAEFSEKSHYSLPPENVPLKTFISSILGDQAQHTLPYDRERVQKVEYKLAKTIVSTFRNEDEEWWLFPQLLEIVRHWLKEFVVYKDNAYPQLLLIDELAHEAADRIHQAIVRVEDNKIHTLLPILRKYDSQGSTSLVSFDTARNVYATAANKCHVSHVVADTVSWEQITAQTLEEMDEVDSYVKNHNLDFTIPYVGYQRQSNTISLRCQCINSVNQVRVSGNACDFRGGKFLEDIRHIVLERRKRLVKLKGNIFLDNLPKSFNRIQLRCIRWKEKESNILRDNQI